MNDVDDPIICNVGQNASDYTCVTFKPDLSKFKLSTLNEDTVEVMMRRTVDVAGTLDGVHVFLNGTKIEVKRFFFSFHESHIISWLYAVSKIL